MLADVSALAGSCEGLQRDRDSIGIDKEQKMRRSVVLVALFSLSLLTGVGPSVATDQSGAVQLCAKNPQCGLIRSKGGVNLWVDHPGGGTTEIWCPDVGQCEVITRTSRNWGFGLGLKVLKTVITPGSLSSSSDSSASVQSAPVPSDDPTPDSPGPIIIN
jgi:hypothetical protein